MPFTQLDDFALDMLDFVIEKVVEARSQLSSREAALSEAGCGFRILRARLHKESEHKLAQLMLVFDDDLEGLREFQENEFETRSAKALKQLVGAKGIFRRN